MRFSVCWLLLLSPLVWANSPRVRLISAEDQTAIIRLEEGAQESAILRLAQALREAGLRTIIFETHHSRLLEGLAARWQENDLGQMMIRAPEAPSARDFPRLDPIEAAAMLQQTDSESGTILENYHRHRDALIRFVFQHGTPEIDPEITVIALRERQAETREQLDRYLSASTEERLKLAQSIDLPANPITRRLADHQAALAGRTALLERGFGPKHPSVKKAQEEIAATHQLALDDLDVIEEALRLRIYQLETRARHLKNWQTLAPEEQAGLRAEYQHASQDYQKSLRDIQVLRTASQVAEKSLAK